MDEIRRIYESTTLSDSEIVEALTRHLDRRISMSRVGAARGKNPSPPQEYATLIRLLALRQYPAKPPERPEAIRTMLERLDASEGIDNKRELRRYLNIALAFAGGRASESELLEVLNNPETPKEIISITLDAMRRSEVPLRALPRILELVDHPWNYIHQETDDSPPPPKRIYPIRVAACECLGRLGIKCEEVVSEDERVDPEWGQKFTTTTIEVDRDSLVATLRAWFRDDDARIWKPAIEAVRRIPGKDVSELIQNLLEDEELPDEKRRLLAK